MKLPQLSLSTEDSLYRTLEVDKSASPETIKRSFHNLARVYHPDKNSENENASTEKFNEIEFAYRILSDDSMRKVYDCCGTRGLRIREQLGEEKFATIQKKGFKAIILMLGALTGCFCCCCCFCCCGKLLRKPNKKQLNGKPRLELEYPEFGEELEIEDEATSADSDPNADSGPNVDSGPNEANIQCSKDLQKDTEIDKLDESDSIKQHNIIQQGQNIEINNEKSAQPIKEEENVQNTSLKQKEITPPNTGVAIPKAKSRGSVPKDAATIAKSIENEKERQEIIANWWVSHVESPPRTDSNTVESGAQV